MADTVDVPHKKQKLSEMLSDHRSVKGTSGPKASGQVCKAQIETRM